jgi:hypothetical protein
MKSKAYILAAHPLNLFSMTRYKIILTRNTDQREAKVYIFVSDRNRMLMASNPYSHKVALVPENLSLQPILAN